MLAQRYVLYTTKKSWASARNIPKLTHLPRDGLKLLEVFVFPGSTEQLHKLVTKSTSSEHTARQRTISQLQGISGFLCVCVLGGGGGGRSYIFTVKFATDNSPIKAEANNKIQNI
jgi:hypothetical protein